MSALDKAIAICDALWQSDKKLWEHFKKHGSQVGVKSKKDYKQKSEELSNKSPGGNISRLTTNSGTIVYEKSSGMAAISRGNELVSYYPLRKAQIQNERKNAVRIEDRKKIKSCNKADKKSKEKL